MRQKLHDHGKMTMDREVCMKTKTMAAGEFKAKCLKVMDQVQARRESVVITKRGKPVAKLVPIDVADDPIFGFMKGKGKIVGDIVSPILTLEEWGDLA
jgi:prevent-host-death family protein